MKVMRKTFCFRLKTNATVENTFEHYAGCARFVFNRALALVKQTLDTQQKMPSFFLLANQLPQLKKSPETAWLETVHSQILQQALKDLCQALKNFFSARKRKKVVGFPQFKKKGKRDSFRYPQSITCSNGKFFLPKIGWVGYYDSRPIEGTIKQATIKKKGGHWYICVLCEVPYTPSPELRTGKTVGIDLGLKNLAALSDGTVVENPKYLNKALNKLEKEQRSLSRKKKGSNNWKKQCKKVAKVHIHVSNARNDFLHKQSTTIVKNHDIIVVENLSISGMIQNRRLSRAIADAGWARFVSFLKYKADWFGKSLIQIDRFMPSSKQCSSCKGIQDMPLCVRRYVCTVCGLDMDRDLNASINILAAGLAVLNACGGNGTGCPGEARISGS